MAAGGGEPPHGAWTIKPVDALGSRVNRASPTAPCKWIPRTFTWIRAPSGNRCSAKWDVSNATGSTILIFTAPI